MNSTIKSLLSLVILAAPLPLQAQSPIAVLQHGYDKNVTGANLAETTLNTANVNVGANTFGLLFSVSVDDKIYAQPLYVPQVAMPGFGTHNLLIVATMSDSVYAFDADAPGAALWSLNLASLFSTTAVPWGQFQINLPPNSSNLGILSTPVIDPATNVLYVVACTLENGTMAYRLHAIDITTGSEPYGPGVLISGSYGNATFNAPYLTQRVSLTLAGKPANQVVFGFGAMEQEADSIGNYVGWVMAYNKQTLGQTGAFATVSTGSGGGGVWQSGRPPAVDGSGDFYVFSGNGWGNGYDGVNDFSESVLKFDVSNGLKLVDWFTPSNWAWLDSHDHDLTSSGPMLIPGTSPALLAGGGKEGDLYVLNATNLGKYVYNNTQIVQEENITGSENGNNEFRAGPAYWNRSAAGGGPLMYHWGAFDTLKAFAFDGSLFSTSPVAMNPYTGMLPGGALAVSANGSQAGTGIVWATRIDPTINANAGVLYAFDASNVANELWNSAMFPSRDTLGSYARFVPPVVSNGKVYAASWSNKVNVYGLGAKPAPFNLNPASLAFGNVQALASSAAQAATVTNIGNKALAVKGITLSGAAAAQYSQVNNCGTSLAVGASCTVNVSFRPAAAGVQGAWLNVTLGGAGTKATALSGTGVSASMGLSPTSLAFGSIYTGKSAAPRAVTVTNTGNAGLSITGIAISGANASQFSQTNTCSSTLAPGSTCSVSVVFSPTVTGSLGATLNISAGSGTANVTLSGTGATPTTFTLSPASLPIGYVTVGNSSTPLPITVTNTGTVSLAASGIGFTGGTPGVFSQTNTCSSAIAPGATCTVNVVLMPVASGYVFSNLNVTGSGGSGSKAVAVTGTGTVPFTALPTSLGFGSVPVGTAGTAQPVTVTNTGSVAMPVPTITFGGASPTSYSQTNNCPASIAAGSSCRISVVFKPTATGTQSATLKLRSPGEAQSVSLTGSGL